MQYETDSKGVISQLSKPLISVLLPLYNCERFIRQTLESLESQTLSAFEVIIVNDGSTDSSRKIVEEFSTKDNRFLILDQTNQGIVAALNNGLSLVKGKYIARVDADDPIHPERLLLQVDYLENNQNCVCVGSLYRTIRDDGSLIWTQKIFSNVRQTDLSIFPPYVASFPHSSIMLRTATLRSINGYRRLFPHAEDYDLFLRLHRMGNLAIIPKHLVDVRLYGGSLSGLNFERQIDSSVMALMSAITYKREGEDIFNSRDSVTMDDLYQAIGDTRTQTLFMRYRQLRLVESCMNRADLSNAKSDLKDLIKALMSDLFALSNDRRFWSLSLASAKLLIKIVLQRIRSVNQR